MTMTKKYTLAVKKTDKAPLTYRLSTTKEKVLIIANTISGKKQLQKQLHKVRSLFSRKINANVQITQSKGHATSLAQEHAESVDMIICCGGDGTLNEVVTGLMPQENKPKIGYIPTGTTNDFAKSMNISQDPHTAATRILDGTPRNYDVGRFNDDYFIYVASFGIFSRSSYATSQQWKNTLGHLAYVLEGAKEIFAMKSYHLKITANGETYEGDYLFGAISNSTSIGGVIKLRDPHVLFDDGLFEVTLIKFPKNPVELASIVSSLNSGKYNKDLITFLHSKHIVIESTEDMPWSLDGEYNSGAKHIEITNVHQAIQVVH